MNTLKFGNGEWYGKKDTILAYNYENSNFKPLPFSFDRNTLATRVNKEGLIETVGSGEPRIDYKDDSKGALLLEPSRSNIIQYSNFNSVWTNPSNLTLNTVVSPEGIQNGNTLSKGSAYDAVSYIISSGVPSGQTAVFSVFVKKNTTNIVGIRLASGSSASDIRKNINLDTGEITDGLAGNQIGFISLEKEDFGNSWYRLKLKGTTSGNDNVCSLYAGSIGTTTNDGEVYVYGAQLEQGSYATSYIPTQGSAVTRVAESCEQTVPDGVIGQTEGTMFFEIDFKNTSEVAGAWSISSGSSANRITMNTIGFSSTQFTLSIAQNYNSSSTKLASTNVTYIDNHKVAIKYSATTLKLFVDGQLSDSVSTDGFGNYTKFYVGGNQVGVGGDARKFIQADLYNTALTDQELINLTTL